MDRDRAKRDAELAVEYRNRLLARGDLTRDEVNQFTVAWILSRRLDMEYEEDQRPEWERG